MSELKPCPHCGSDATVHEHIWDRGKPSYTIECNNDDCIGHHDSEEAAIVAWNRRAPASEGEQK